MQQPPPTARFSLLATGTVTAGLLLAVLLAYGPHLTNGFVFDDHAQIEQSPFVNGTRPLGEAFTSDVWVHARSTLGAGHLYYRPLFVALNRALYLLGGGAPWAYHLASLLLFLGALALGYALLTRLGLSHAQTLAAIVLLGLHPAAAESIFWAGCLSELVLLDGLLAALLCLVAARTRCGPGRLLLLVTATACTLVALLSKETAVVIAVIVTVEAWLSRPPQRRSRLLATTPIWLATFAYLVVRGTILGKSAVGALVPNPLGAAGRAGYALLWDLTHLLLPSPLSPFHGFPSTAADPWVRFPGLGVLAVLLLGGLFLLSRRPAWSLWPAWLLLPLLPRLAQLFFTRQTGTVVAERYLLLSLAPFSVLLVLGVGHTLRRFSPQHSRVVAVVLVLVAGVLGGASSYRYGRAFVDDDAYFGHADRIEPNQPIVLVSRASLLMKRARYADALPLLQRAVKLEPTRAHAQLNLGLTLAQLGQAKAALRTFELAVRLDGSIAGAHLQLAHAYRAAGRLDEAGRHFALELRVDPTNVSAAINLGTYHYLKNDVPTAIRHWSHAAALRKASADVHFNLGMAYRRLGDRREAAQHLRRFLKRAGQQYVPQQQLARSWLSSP